MTTLETTLYRALKEIEEAEVEEERYRSEVIGAYPMVEIPESVRTQWINSINGIAARQFAARKAAQELITMIERTLQS